MSSTHIVVATTPDKRTVAALSQHFVDPARITDCLESAARSLGGAEVVGARCVAIPLSSDPWAFAVCGELRLTKTDTDASVAAEVLSRALRRAGFQVR